MAYDTTSTPPRIQPSTSPILSAEPANEGEPTVAILKFVGVSSDKLLLLEEFVAGEDVVVVLPSNKAYRRNDDESLRLVRFTDPTARDNKFGTFTVTLAVVTTWPIFKRVGHEPIGFGSGSAPQKFIGRGVIKSEIFSRIAEILGHGIPASKWQGGFWIG